MQNPLLVHATTCHNNWMADNSLPLARAYDVARFYVGVPDAFGSKSVVKMMENRK